MSDILFSSENVSQTQWVRLTDNGRLKEAEKMLAGIQGGLRKAFGSAATRTAKSSTNLASNDIRKEYIISDSDFKKYTHSSFKSDANGVSIEFKGWHIPLIAFEAKFGKDGKVSARVKRSSSRKILDNAFVRSVSRSHTGIFERILDERLPIREFFGPSVPQMMSYNEELQEAIAEHTRETFEKRFDHEVMRILNGWGGKR